MKDFINWYNKNVAIAQFYRLGVSAVIILVQTCIIIPATILLLAQSEFSNIIVGLSTVLSFSILVSIISGVRIQIPIILFLFNILTHLVMVSIAI